MCHWGLEAVGGFLLHVEASERASLPVGRPRPQAARHCRPRGSSQLAGPGPGPHACPEPAPHGLPDAALQQVVKPGGLSAQLCGSRWFGPSRARDPRSVRTSVSSSVGTRQGLTGCTDPIALGAGTLTRLCLPPSHTGRVHFCASFISFGGADRSHRKSSLSSFRSGDWLVLLSLDLLHNPSRGARCSAEKQLLWC